MDEVKPYSWMVPMLVGAMGRPARQFKVDGEPQGFSVARKVNARVLAIKAWKAKIIHVVEHRYPSRAPIATIERPVYVHVEPYFSDRRHCDPENVRKLLVDALYQDSGPGSGQDKYVFGSHSGPMYSLMEPCTRVWVWQVDGQEPPIISETARAEAKKKKLSKQRKADKIETARSEAKREKIRVRNPFGIKS